MKKLLLLLFGFLLFFLVKAKLEEAIKVGHDILKNGGISLDAVEKPTNVLEDSALFNAI